MLFPDKLSPAASLETPDNDQPEPADLPSSEDAG
jgi:hypothetical protein